MVDGNVLAGSLGGSLGSVVVVVVGKLPAGVPMTTWPEQAPFRATAMRTVRDWGTPDREKPDREDKGGA